MNAATTHTHTRQKFVGQTLALVTLGAVLMLIWNVVENTSVADVQGRVLNPLSRLLSDLYLFLSISFLSILLGVVCAFYLQEWLLETNWVRHLIESQVGIFSSVPSLLYGVLGTTIFLPYCRASKTFEAPLSSGTLGNPSIHPDRTILFWAVVLTFVLLVMPRTMQTTQAALRSVPTPIREAAYALGANRQQVLVKHVVPFALPQVLAGGCRAMSCAFAAVALFVGTSLWGQGGFQTGYILSGFALFLGGALLLSIFSSFLGKTQT